MKQVSVYFRPTTLVAEVGPGPSGEEDGGSVYETLSSGNDGPEGVRGHGTDNSDSLLGFETWTEGPEWR